MRAVAALLVILVAGSCAGGPGAGSASTRPAAPGAGVASATVAAASSPALATLLTTRLTDVRSGQTFTLAEFSGKVVIVEGMAVW